MQSILKKWRWKYLGVPVGALLGIGLYLGFLQLTGNLHETVTGELYRSAQLEPGDTTRYVQQYHIKSVLNLRGSNTNRDWYRTEVQEAHDNHIEHLDFRMSAKHELTQAQVAELITIMRNAPKPLLIHCRSGADRSGLAAALYVAAISKGSEAQAERQLWVMYGHIPLWFTKAYAMDRTFDAMKPYLGFPHS